MARRRHPGEQPSSPWTVGVPNPGAGWPATLASAVGLGVRLAVGQRARVRLAGARSRTAIGDVALVDVFYPSAGIGCPRWVE